MAIDNNTGKDKEFYELGKKMFDQIKPLKPIKPYVDPIQADIDLLYEVNSADIAALEDAKETLNVLRLLHDEGVFQEIIDESLALISKALKMNYGDSMERLVKQAIRKL
jgi:pimeloyl-CoA synthetase